MSVTIFQLAAAAVAGAVCMVTLRKQTAELAVLLGVVTCALLLLAVGQGCAAIFALLGELAELAQVDSVLLTPLLRTVGIALVTGLAAQVCRDSGAESIAAVLELCGGLCAIYAAMPLIRTVFELIRDLL